MTDYEIPPPEPKPIDEQNWLELKDKLERATLKGKPMGRGEVRQLPLLPERR